MLIRKTAYYDQFQCIAGQCPDSCCKEWDVQVDPASADAYRKLEGPLGDRLRQVLTTDENGETVMTIENGRCPMWREDGLCRIQAELGEEALCRVCRQFPRLEHDYGDFLELGLELSCPEAARLILSAPALPLTCQESDIPGEAEYDWIDMDILLRTRRQALDILSCPDYSPTQALTLLLIFGYHAQAELDGMKPEPFSPAAALNEARSLAREADPTELLRFFLDLEILTDRWKNLLLHPGIPSPWTQQHKNLSRYFVERYWLQAISDLDIVCRAKLAVVSCILVRTLGGDICDTAQLYSKETENNADNMDAILDAAYTHPAFTDDRLLWHLHGF